MAILRAPTAAPAAPGPAEVYAALWLGALLVAAGELCDPFPAEIEELAREYFERWPGERGGPGERRRPW